LLRLARRLGQAFAAYFFNSAVQLVTSVIGCRSAARLFGTLDEHLRHFRRYEKDELDLNVLVETETTLALPMKPLCREDCLGLCPVCGGNRNVVTCGCRDRAPDPRLAVLKDLAARRSR